MPAIYPPAPGAGTAWRHLEEGRQGVGEAAGGHRL